MHKLTRFASAAAAIAMATAPAAMSGVAATASAAPPEAGQATLVPFATILRRCDFSVFTYVSAAGVGRPLAHVRTTGANQVVADVQLATATPHSYFEVRLIQVPRLSSASCEAGADGVTVGAINTDGVGAGTVTLQGDIRPWATGAWIAIERPARFSQTPEEFYTSDLIADI